MPENAGRYNRPGGERAGPSLFSPPFRVGGGPPPLPAIHPIVGSGNAMSNRVLGVPLSRTFHVRPLSLVDKMVPKAPTAQPSFSLRNRTAYRWTLLPVGWSCHEAPPSSVERMVPSAPAIQPRLSSRNVTS